MKIFSKAWIRSKKPKKQRKYRYNAPSHIKHKFLGAHLSKELIKKYNKRSIQVRKDDKVKIMRGKYKGKEEKVAKVLVKKSKIYIENIQITKLDGTKIFVPITPSNVMITELNLTDKKRKKILERKNG